MVKAFEIKSQQADDGSGDDDDDDDDSSAQHLLEEMLNSLIRRIIASELEDFELVS